MALDWSWEQWKKSFQMIEPTDRGGKRPFDTTRKVRKRKAAREWRDGMKRKDSCSDFSYPSNNQTKLFLEPEMLWVTSFNVFLLISAFSFTSISIDEITHRVERTSQEIVRQSIDMSGEEAAIKIAKRSRKRVSGIITSFFLASFNSSKNYVTISLSILIKGSELKHFTTPCLKRWWK